MSATAKGPGGGRDVSVDLGKVDQVRERMGVSYEEACAALDAVGGDVVAAVTRLEQTRGPADLLTVGADLLDEVERLLRAGAIKKIRVRLGNRTLKEIPVSLTAVGAVLIGILAVLVSRFVIELEREG
jgi:predicted NBD/HSP70 family sugar kinase